MADDARLSLPQAMDADRAPGPLRLSDAEYEHLQEFGALDRLGRIELRGGELWRMSPIFVAHADMRRSVGRSLETALEALGCRVLEEVTVKFPVYQPNPDVVAFLWRKQRKQIPAEDVRLVVEVSDTTLEDDLGDKKNRYAVAGLSEYWVVDMPHRQVLRFHAPKDGAFEAATPIPAGSSCPSLTLAGVAVETADWPWDVSAD